MCHVCFDEEDDIWQDCGQDVEMESELDCDADDDAMSASGRSSASSV